jgi:hypothetical protein
MPISPIPLCAVGRLLIGNVQEVDFDMRDVEVNRNMIFSERRIHDSASAIVEQRLLCKRYADSHNDAAAKLARGGRGIYLPESGAQSHRDTRTSPVSSCTRTSQNCAPYDAMEYFRSSIGAPD